MLVSISQMQCFRYFMELGIKLDNVYLSIDGNITLTIEGIEYVMNREGDCRVKEIKPGYTKDSLRHAYNEKLARENLK